MVSSTAENKYMCLLSFTVAITVPDGTFVMEWDLGMAVMDGICQMGQ